MVVACLLAALSLPASGQHAAEIVSIKGKSDHGRAPTGPWAPARVQQRLPDGTWLRTQQDTKVALLFVDETTTDIFSNTVAQIKQPEAAAPRKSIIDFQRGKARIETKTPAKSFGVTTPTGVAAIRGTEWLVEVADDGTSAFTVVEGEVELSNEHGTLLVASNEQGVLERGKPPFKRRVQNARERIQWVSQFEVRASDYPDAARASPRAVEALEAGDLEAARRVLAAAVGPGDAPAIYFLLADIALYRGEAAEAIDWLTKAAARFPDEPRTQGLLARAYLFADDMPRAREAAAQARARHAGTLESQIHAAEVARIDGDFGLAREALRQATRIAPDDWRGWHALGRLHAERADFRRGRRALDAADRLSPRNATVLGERGMLEANAYDLPLARESLQAALAARADDFATWMGLGVARLRSGDPGGALEALRKASALEPRYARVHVYLAVAYWQQGRADDALAQLRTASIHDPKDPLPYQFASIIQADLMRPGDAVAAAREAMARLAYTKSLDPIANNLRGGANLGAPLAQLNLEAWALKNAHDSYDPLWAGSHLFLADRLAGKFAANSELVQGFLADPLAFGASNRFSPLVPRPGHHATLAWRAARSRDETISEPLVNANGLAGEGRFAYFAEASGLRLRQPDRGNDERAPSYTLALGARPRDDIGFFLYANRLDVDARIGIANGTFEVEGPTTRVDAGVMYRPGPDTQVWLKAGGGSQRSTNAERVSFSSATLHFLRDSDFSTEPRSRDVGARAIHRLAGGIELSCAAEADRWRSREFFARDLFPRLEGTSTRLLETLSQDIRDRSAAAELAVRVPARSVAAEVQLGYARYDRDHDLLLRRDPGQEAVGVGNYETSRWTPRAGIVWKPVEALTVRAAYQRWLRTWATGSLRSPSTAGMVLDERYVLPGGLFERARAQLEWQAGPNVLVTVFGDRQEIDNLSATFIGVANFRPDPTNLDRLRNRTFEPLSARSDSEGFARLSNGRLTEGGFAVNALAAGNASFFAEGTWASGENTNTAFAGNRLAFLPKRVFAIGAAWFSERRWSIAARAVHRGERFADEENAIARPSEWSGAVLAYWESPAKRWSVEFLVANIGARSSDETYGIGLNYRF